MLIHKAFKYRIYPTPEQEAMLRQHCGNTRFIYNLFLDMCIKHYKETGKTLKTFDLTYKVKELRNEYEFLQLSNFTSLQQVAYEVSAAYKNFFEKRTGFPKFKNKYKSAMTCKYFQSVHVSNTHIKIPKVGFIKIKLHRPLDGKQKSTTVSFSNNKWFASVACEIEVQDKELKHENIVGIDLGIKSFASLSDGTTIENQRITSKYEKKLRREQRRLSRKQLGSQNRIKQIHKVASVHEKIRNTRSDFLHKQSSQLINDYDGFVVEDLNVAGMMKNKKLSKHIADASWNSFNIMLEYKSKWNFKHYAKIGRFFPSSKTCSDCGALKTDMNLSIRNWTCEECGSVHDRDTNAARNILSEGLRTLTI